MKFRAKYSNNKKNKIMRLIKSFRNKNFILKSPLKNLENLKGNRLKKIFKPTDFFFN